VFKTTYKLSLEINCCRADTGYTNREELTHPWKGLQTWKHFMP